MAYVVVVNATNNCATVHLDDCFSLQGEPLKQTKSAERLGVADGLDAIVAAKRAGKKSTVLCGHCLRAAAQIITLVN